MPAAGVLMAFLVVFCSAAQLLSLGIGFLCFVCAPQCLCGHVCESVWFFLHRCIYMPTCERVDKDGGGKEQDVAHISLSSHMVMYPSSFHVFLLCGLITAVFTETSGNRTDSFSVTMLHVHTLYLTLH